MNTKPFLIVALLASAFAPALSNAAVNSMEPGYEFSFSVDDADADVRGGAPGERKMVRAVEIRGGDAVMAGMPHPALGGALMLPLGKLVKNAPYTAEVINEQQQTLADGNQIVKKHTSLSYRDSAGRTRQEMRDDSGAVKSISIHDPAAGYSVILNPATKTGVKRIFASLPPRALARAGELRQDRMAMRLERGAARREGMEGKEGKEGMPGREQIIVKRIERAEGQATARIHENVRIQVLGQMEGRAMPGLERLNELGPMLAGSFGDMKWSSKATVRELGSKDIEGVNATGKLRSYDIPAGAIGNRNAIVVSNESWFSPELQVTVMMKRSDPRTGEKIYRLAGIKRDEPAAALFAIPSDYAVREPTVRIERLEKKMEEKK